jgi:hypothetical protein
MEIACEMNTCGGGGGPILPPSSPGTLETVLTNVNDFLLGMEAEVVYNNSFGLTTNLEAGSGETTAMTAGRIMGDVITTAQGLGEMGGGASLMGGGAGVCVATVVGCIAIPVAETAGVAAIIHGALLTSQATGELIENVATMASKGSSGNEPSVLQSGKHTLTSETLRELGLTTDEGKAAIEALKGSYGIPGNVHGKIMSNGDWIDPRTGEIVDNLYGYLP